MGVLQLNRCRDSLTQVPDRSDGAGATSREHTEPAAVAAAARPAGYGRSAAGQPPYGQPQASRTAATSRPAPVRRPPGQPPTGSRSPAAAELRRPAASGQLPTPPAGYPTCRADRAAIPPQPGQPGAGGPSRSAPPARKARPGSSWWSARSSWLIIIGVGAAILVNRTTDTTTSPVDPTDPTPPAAPVVRRPGTTAPPPASTKADESVKAIWRPWPQANATAALSLAKDQPTDKSFLTDAVLAESNKRAPITEIRSPRRTASTTAASRRPTGWAASRSTRPSPCRSRARLPALRGQPGRQPGDDPQPHPAAADQRESGSPRQGQPVPARTCSPAAAPTSPTAAGRW